MGVYYFSQVDPDIYMLHDKLALYLDDVRDPEPSDELTWIVCRTGEEFMECHKTFYQKISMYSFDHDLGDGEPTGYELAKWMVNRMMDYSVYCEILFNVHSANPVGSVNIEKFLSNWNNFVREKRKDRTRYVEASLTEGISD